MAESWIITTILSGINILLILGLLYVYVKNLIKIRSGFTIGLVLFVSLFLFQNSVVFYFSITMMPLYTESVRIYMMVFMVLQSLAFSILNWITWK